MCVAGGVIQQQPDFVPILVQCYSNIGSESDVCRRQFLSTKVYPRTEGMKYL